MASSNIRLIWFQGTDVTKLEQQRRFSFVDCLNSNDVSSESDALASSEKTISDAITKISGEDRQVLLILDNPDVLLATGLATAHRLTHFIMKLRTLVHATVISCSADAPFISAAREHTALPLDAELAAFIAQQAHAARYVLSVRPLDTGAAKDISGVLRVTRGGGVYDSDDAEKGEIRDMEALYLVQRDGNAKVFGRGAEMR